MQKILVTYSTYSGSTVEVAQAIGKEIAERGVEVDVLRMSEVESLAGYDAVVAGGPMIMGWHRSALGFLKRHRKALQSIPFAVFVTAMSLTQTGETDTAGVPVSVDPKLPKPPARPGRLSFRERYATLGNYLRPILGATRPGQPVSVGFFGGRLEYGRLKWYAVLFVMLIVQAQAGDRRNWDAIRSWAADLPGLLGVGAAT